MFTILLNNLFVTCYLMLDCTSWFEWGDTRLQFCLPQGLIFSLIANFHDCKLSVLLVYIRLQTKASIRHEISDICTPNCHLVYWIAGARCLQSTVSRRFLKFNIDDCHKILLIFYILYRVPDYLLNYSGTRPLIEYPSTRLLVPIPSNKFTLW